MRIGYGLITCQRFPGDSRAPADLYRQALELARACQAAGLDSVWTSEHHFVDDDYMPSLLVTSAAIAASTERIAIGTGVLLAPLHHPLRLAEDAATVDVISNGRLILGLGLGWRPEEFDRLRVPRGGLGRQLAETVRVLRLSWGPEPFAFEGRSFSFGPTFVTPKPVRPIPIWIGGRADAALRRAGRIGDGYLGTSVPFADLVRHRGLVEEGLARSGRDPAGFTFSVHEPVWVSEDPEREIDEILPHLHYVRWKYRDMHGAYGRGGGPLPSPPPLDERTRAGLLSEMIAGTPREAAAKIAAFRDFVGERGHFVARSCFPGVSHERNLRMVELLGEVKRLVVTV